MIDTPANSKIFHNDELIKLAQSYFRRIPQAHLRWEQNRLTIRTESIAEEEVGAAGLFANVLLHAGEGTVSAFADDGKINLSGEGVATLARLLHDNLHINFTGSANIPRGPTVGGV